MNMYTESSLFPAEGCALMAVSSCTCVWIRAVHVCCEDRNKTPAPPLELSNRASKHTVSLRRRCRCEPTEDRPNAPEFPLLAAIRLRCHGR